MGRGGSGRQETRGVRNVVSRKQFVATGDVYSGRLAGRIRRRERWGGESYRRQARQGDGGQDVALRNDSITSERSPICWSVRTNHLYFLIKMSDHNK